MWNKRHLPCTIQGRRTGISYHIHCRTDIHYFMGVGAVGQISVVSWGVCRVDISCLMEDCRTDISYIMGNCTTDISCLMGGLQGRYQLSHGGLQNRYQLSHGELQNRYQLSHGGNCRVDISYQMHVQCSRTEYQLSDIGQQDRFFIY